MSTAQATATRAHDTGHGDHVIPLKLYVKIYLALIVLTVITVAVSMADLGKASIWVAMVVAMVKGGLVAAYFMHLKYDSGVVRLVFIGTLVFLAIFFVFTMLDLGTRDSVSEETGTFFQRDEKARIEGARGGAGAPPPGQPTRPFR